MAAEETDLQDKKFLQCPCFKGIPEEIKDMRTVGALREDKQ